jgi:Fe-S-cluster containining protein
MAKVPIQFRIWDETVSEEVDAPDRMRLDEVLPVLRKIDDQLIGIAARLDGGTVSCAKGCSACCKVQPVPVTPAEAYALLLLVEALPEPRRGAIVERFEQAAARLRESGAAEGYLEGSGAGSDAEARANAERYLALGLACPFLEDDVCGIYGQRPFACREYLVTSPAEYCTDPLRKPVKPVANVLRPAAAVLAVEAEFSGSRPFTIPLTLALIYAVRRREELQRTYPAVLVLNRAVDRLLLSNCKP